MVGTNLVALLCIFSNSLLSATYLGCRAKVRYSNIGRTRYSNSKGNVTSSKIVKVHFISPSVWFGLVTVEEK